MKNILSIQSSVVSGHVGNQAAALPLQRQGFDVWCIPTVLYSNHPAHGAHRGRIVPPVELDALIGGVADLHGFSNCGAVLSGYLGSAATGAVVAQSVRRVRRANPAAFYLCDPVIGDHGRRYVDADIIDVFRCDLVPLADIVTPNAFEAALLTAIDISGVADACRAARALAGAGRRRVAITGIEADHAIATVIADRDALWQVTTPRIDHPAHGAGDLFAALLVGRLLRGHTVADAAAHAVSVCHAVVEWAAQRGGSDLPLVEAQDCLASPPHRFMAEPVGFMAEPVGG